MHGALWCKKQDTPSARLVHIKRILRPFIPPRWDVELHSQSRSSKKRANESLQCSHLHISRSDAERRDEENVESGNRKEDDTRRQADTHTQELSKGLIFPHSSSPFPFINPSQLAILVINRMSPVLLVLIAHPVCPFHPSKAAPFSPFGIIRP